MATLGPGTRLGARSDTRAASTPARTLGEAHVLDVVDPVAGQLARIVQELSNVEQLAGPSTALGRAVQTVIDALGVLGTRLETNAGVQQLNSG
jgi:hypothetical protein